MPLHDSFKRKSRTNIVKLSAPPTPEDLAYGMSQAIQPRGEPQAFGWSAKGSERVLYIVRGYGGNEVSWILRSGEESDAPVVWRYSTSDFQTIYTLLAEETAEPEPAAVIPDYLKPRAEEEQSAEGNSPSGSSDGRLNAALSEISDPEESTCGTIFADRYEIVDKVGHGAMGTVYRARQRFIDRIVALKVLHRHLVTEEIHRKRFAQEAKAASALNHPNLITIYDFGFALSGRPFIAMEFVQGQTLQDLLEERRTLDRSEFIELFSQCCLAMMHAHQHSIVHRDLKPSNIILTVGDDSRLLVKVVDFGLAKITAGNIDQELTGSENVVGSPYFMSPEQCRGEELDARTDIYSLGCVMYQAVTGVLPFVGSDVFQTLYKHVYESAPPFAAAAPGVSVSPDLEAMVFKSLEIDPSRRYQSAAELLAELEHLARGRSVQTAAFGSAGRPDGLRQGTQQSSYPDANQGPQQGAHQDLDRCHVQPIQGQAQVQTQSDGHNRARFHAEYESPLQSVQDQLPVQNQLSGQNRHATQSQPSGQQQHEAEPWSSDYDEYAAYDNGETADRKEPECSQSVYESDASSPASLSLVYLIEAAQLVSSDELHRADELRRQLGGEVAALLVAHGKIHYSVFDALNRCKALLESGKISEAHAITLLRYCNVTNVDFTRALKELGWNLS